VRGNLVAPANERLGELGILLQCHCDGVGREIPIELSEEPEETPGRAAGAILKVLLGVEVSRPLFGAAARPLLPEVGL
jgi:hypothetical protein